MRLAAIKFTIKSDKEQLRSKGNLNKFTSNINMFLFILKFITIHKEQGQLFFLTKYFFLLHDLGSMIVIGHLEKLPICPTSSLCSEFYPRNIIYMPVVKFFKHLEFEQIFLFFKAPYSNCFSSPDLHLSK